MRQEGGGRREGRSRMSLAQGFGLCLCACAGVCSCSECDCECVCVVTLSHVRFLSCTSFPLSLPPFLSLSLRGSLALARFRSLSLSLSHLVTHWLAFSEARSRSLSLSLRAPGVPTRMEELMLPLRDSVLGDSLGGPSLVRGRSMSRFGLSILASSSLSLSHHLQSQDFSDSHPHGAAPLGDTEAKGLEKATCAQRRRACPGC
jgi:hypothetical protein